jgi:hypothetical protein
MSDDKPLDMKPCCRCFRESPVRLESMIPVKRKGGRMVKRFYCPECAASRGQRVPPIGAAIPNRTIDGLWNWGSP